MWKRTIKRIGLWMIRVLVREGKKELAEFVIRDVVEDPKVPRVGSIMDLADIRMHFPREDR